MLCEICKKNNATFFYKQTKNGITHEKNLCVSCAKEQGYAMNNGFFDTDLGIDNFFGGLMSSFSPGQPMIVPAQKCTKCGMTLGEIVHSGKVGCAECYGVFRKSLIPTITKLHGNVAHCGGFPEYAQTEQPAENTPTEITPTPETKPITKKEELEELKKKLAEAVELQEYEAAAEFRDKIKSIEKELSEGGEGK